jgi:hypothetical protein
MQIAIRSLDGMATMFKNTQIIDVRATTENQLLQIFRSIAPDAIYENAPLALVQSSLSNYRQIKTLKAIMVSPTYWKYLIGVASPSVVAQINVHPLTSDFLLLGDRFIYTLYGIAPKQYRHNKTYEIALVGGVGQVDLGLPFVSASLTVTGATPTVTFPSTGLLQFAAGDVGTLIDATFVTAPVYKVIKVVRTHDQISDSNGSIHPVYAYVMHPLLATALGITIPTI